MLEFSPFDYGAAGDGVTDDRAAVQAAIDAAIAAGGAVVLDPLTTFAIGQDGGNPYSLLISGRVRMVGHGMGNSTLKLLSTAGASVRMIKTAAGSDFSYFSDFTLDGNWSNLSFQANKQRHGYMLQAGEHVIIERVEIKDCDGDGIALYLDTDYCTIRDCYIHDCQRDGVSLIGYGRGNLLVNNRLVNNVAQQVDTETGVSGNVFHQTRIIGNYIDAGSSNDYAITLGGSDAANLSEGTITSLNVVVGSIRTIYSDNTSFVGNVVRQATTKSCIEVYRTNTRTTIVGNCLYNYPSSGIATLQVLGTNAEYPDQVTITGNTIKSNYNSSTGVRVENTAQAIVSSNTIVGLGDSSSSTSYGIIARYNLLSPDPEGRSVQVIGNYVKDYSSAGVILAGNGAARAKRFVGIGNVFDDQAATARMLTTIDLDGNPKTTTWRQVVWQGNSNIGGCTLEARATNKTTPYLTGGNQGFGAVYGFPNSKG